MAIHYLSLNVTPEYFSEEFRKLCWQHLAKNAGFKITPEHPMPPIWTYFESLFYGRGTETLRFLETFISKEELSNDEVALINHLLIAAIAGNQKHLINDVIRTMSERFLAIIRQDFLQAGLITAALNNYEHALYEIHNMIIKKIWYELFKSGGDVSTERGL